MTQHPGLKVAISNDPRPSRGGRPPKYARPDGPLSAFELLLPSLVARGFSAAALQYLFGVGQAEFERIAAREGQVAAGTRALRVSKAANGWTLDQMQRLLILWSTNLFATCIGERIGRSAASVRAKAKALGLPARDRRKLTRSLPPTPLGGLLPPEHKPWTTADEWQLGEEHLRGVRTEATAVRLRRGVTHTRNSISRLQLPPRWDLRGKLKDEFDPAEPYLEKFAKQGWHFRQCISSKNMIWTPRGGDRVSKAHKKTKAWLDAHGGVGEACAGDY